MGPQEGACSDLWAVGKVHVFQQLLGFLLWFSVAQSGHSLEERLRCHGCPTGV